MPYKNPQQQAKYQREWVARRRAEWVEANGPCAICGSGADLEVDHIDPSQKEAKISTLWSWDAERRYAELAKCQVLCRLCHRDKTDSELRAAGELACGTHTGYAHFGCRCSECKSAHRDYNRARRNLAKTG